MKTKDEIDELKRQWRRDPCWDIEDTEGFEDHHDELLEWSNDEKSQSHANFVAEMLGKAEEMGCHGNWELAAYMDRLEVRIKALERKDE